MPSAYTRRGYMIVTAADRDRANTAALQLDPVGGQYTFTVGLNASGDPNDTPTHYHACAAFTEDGWTQVQQLATAFPEGVLAECSVDGLGGEPAQAQLSLGVQPIRAEV